MLGRRVAVGLVFLLVASACASVVNGDSTESGSIVTSSMSIDAAEVFEGVSVSDGKLDCASGLVVRAVDIEVSAATEVLAVSRALEEWTSKGAMLVAPAPEGFWSAVLDGFDVAIALPEPDGDGTWVVHDVQTCGEPETGSAPIDGELDCVSDTSWAMTGTPDPTFVGLATAEDAVRSSLEWYTDRYGGEIMMTGDGAGALVVDQREQVIARSGELPAGGWGVSAVLGCDGYEFVR